MFIELTHMTGDAVDGPILVNTHAIVKLYEVDNCHTRIMFNVGSIEVKEDYERVKGMMRTAGVYTP